MPLFQVICREIVNIDRTYEIEADSAKAASEAIDKSEGEAGELVDEQVQDTYSFKCVQSVFDEDGNKVS